MLISEKMKKGIELDEVALEPNYNGKAMNIEIASTCNENCIYCPYAAQGLHKDRKFINEKVFYEVTKEAYELGITDIGLYITAEPFMNPKIYDYVKYLKQDLGFKYVYISTNGILCTPSNLIKLVNAGIDSIKFSVSAATKENFKKHHGIDALEAVKRNIEFAYKYREENHLQYKLFMFSIITKFNYDEKELIEKTFSPYLDEIVYAEVLDGIIKMKGVEEHLVINKNNSNISGSNTLPCPQLFNRIVVDVDGYLCACCYVGDNLTKVLDLSKTSLKAALYSDEFKAIRKKHLNNDIKNTICNRCINGIIENMKPFNTEFNDINKDCINREDEILERFKI